MVKAQFLLNGKNGKKPVVVAAHTFNLSTQEAGESLLVQGLPGLQRVSRTAAPLQKNK